MGSESEGKFYETITQGIEKVTVPFPKVDFTKIHAEIRREIPFLEKEILPDTVGGGPVHMLMGIKDLSIHPQLIKVLPSGLAVYRSAFMDSSGSTIIIAGTHELLKKQLKPDDVQQLNTVLDNIQFLKESQ